MPTPQEERRRLLLDLRDNFELEYQKVALQLTPVLHWIKTRRWPGAGPVPEWVQEFEHVKVEEAEAFVQVRALAMTVADTILRATRPDLPEVPPMPGSGNGNE